MASRLEKIIGTSISTLANTLGEPCTYSGRTFHGVLQLERQQGGLPDFRTKATQHSGYTLTVPRSQITGLTFPAGSYIGIAGRRWKVELVRDVPGSPTLEFSLSPGV